MCGMSRMFILRAAVAESLCLAKPAESFHVSEKNPSLRGFMAQLRMESSAARNLLSDLSYKIYEETCGSER